MFQFEKTHAKGCMVLLLEESTLGSLAFMIELQARDSFDKVSSVFNTSKISPLVENCSLQELY